jgi:hypothetical protein
MKEEGADIPRYLNIQRYQWLETSPSCTSEKVASKSYGDNSTATSNGTQKTFLMVK